MSNPFLNIGTIRGFLKPLKASRPVLFELDGEHLSLVSISDWRKGSVLYRLKKELPPIPPSPWVDGKQNPDFVRSIYDKYISPLRIFCRERGYAVTVHGSLARDIDLLAVPWVESAVPAEELVAEILKRFNWFLNEDAHDPELKPHGRKVWSLHSIDFKSTFIDFGVMPTQAKP